MPASNLIGGNLVTPGSSGNFITPEIAPDLLYGGAPENIPNAKVGGGTVGGVTVISAPLLQKWRKAIATVRCAAGNATVDFVGDSTTTGVGAGTGAGADPSTTDASPRAYPARMATLFGSYGLNANRGSFWGANDTGTTLAKFQEYDTRITIGAGWVLDSDWLAGPRFRAPAGVTTSFAFNPGFTTDRIQVMYLQTPGGGTFTVDIGGAALITQSTNGATGSVKTAVISATRGANTYNIKSDGTANVFLIGAEAWDSQTPSVLCRNIGRSGGTAAGRFALISPLLANPADLTVIKYGLNDMHNGVSAAAFQASMQSIISSITGDMVLVVPNPGSSSWADLSLQAEYALVVKTLGQTNNIPVIDLPARYISYVNANSNGLMFNDPHPNQLGYADEAMLIAKAIASF